MIELKRGDNLEILKTIKTGTIDLIYIDPPFYSQRDYKEFDDRWDSFEIYVENIMSRIKECHRILKDTGSIYIHLDPTASHMIKVETDNIFGRDNFRNEIIWERSHIRSSLKKNYRKTHDCILFYSKTDKYTFNIQYKPITGNNLKSYKYENENGKYALVPLLVSGAVKNGETGKIWRGIDPNKFGKNGMHWVTIFEKLEKYDKKGKIYWPKKQGGLPRLKYYLSENKGLPIINIWNDVGILESNSKESTGYPTAKPLKLLERIISASSNEGDLVLDPTNGSGTTALVCKNMNRNFIGIDKNENSIKITKDRLS